MKKKRTLIIIIVLIAVAVITSFKLFPNANKDLPLERIKLPSGFTISIYAEVPNARSMVMSDNGTLYVGNRSEDKVYAVQDTDGDMVGDKNYIIDQKLNMPNGVALKDGDLYVATVSKILKYENIEATLDNPPEPTIIYDGYPTEKHHGWKYIAFGPDGLLYVPVGAPCNVCDRDEAIYASITRIDVDNPSPEIIAKGVRNSVGFDWDPKTGKLWFTDNGRDMMGDDTPPCELNVISRDSQHFGFPYCHGGEILDPKFGKEKSCSGYSSPAWKFGAHVAPLGINFYGGGMFPNSYENKIFVAQHGSWNRSKKSGYVVMLMDNNKEVVNKAAVFASGWLDDKTQKSWGRPVDIITLKDGSILVSDDYAGVIYRISYESN